MPRYSSDGLLNVVRFFNALSSTPTHSEGTVFWDPDDHTISLMPDIENVILQVGQELWVRVVNDEGAQIDNGKAVYISGVNGSGLPQVKLALADDIATSRIIGLVTEDIAIGAQGFVTVVGAVRDIDTNAFTVGDTVYLSDSSAGDLVDVKPEVPSVGVAIGTVTIKGVSDGVVWVGGSRTFRVTTPAVFTGYLERNQRNFDQQVYGGFNAVITAGAVASGSPLSYTHGISKLFIVINAGADVDGTLTITGDSVDRNTGAVTVGDTENITIDALTTDASDTDAQGNIRHSFTGAYITSKWFKGALTLSTADLNISDLDIYGVSFEQVNDTPDLTLKTFNITTLCTNAAAWFYGYLYKLNVTTATKKADLTREASLNLDVGDTAADRHYRLRRGNLDVAFDGRKDGFWFEVFFGPDANSYFDNTAWEVWFDFVHNLE